MDFLAAFFLIGLMLSGIKVFVRHLIASLDRFNHTETFLLENNSMTHANLLSAVSHETNRRDTNYIRVTSTKESNDRIKRLAFPATGAQQIGYEPAKMQRA